MRTQARRAPAPPVGARRRFHAFAPFDRPLRLNQAVEQPAPIHPDPVTAPYRLGASGRSSASTAYGVSGYWSSLSAHSEVILPIHTLLVVPGAAVPLDLFFVLSGFLITALLLREQSRWGSIGTGAFSICSESPPSPSRALRRLVLANALFAYATHQLVHTETPSIFSGCSSTIPISPSASAAGPLPRSWLRATSTCGPWRSRSSSPTSYGLGSPSFRTIRVRLRTVVIVIMALIILVDVHRIILWEQSPRWWSYLYRTDTRADSILWGALLAHLWMRYKEPKRWLPIAGWVAAAFLIYCLAFTTEYSSFLYLGGFDAIDVACALLLLAILDGRWGGRHLFEWKPLVAMGVVSYAFYLWHLPVFFAIRYFDPHWNNVVRVIVALSATMTLTLISWFAMERPLMRWSKRMEDSRRVKLDTRPDGEPVAPTGDAVPARLEFTTDEIGPAPLVTGSSPSPSAIDPSGASDVRPRRPT